MLISSINAILSFDTKQSGWPGWMIGEIDGPFVIKSDSTYFIFFTWTRGYGIGLLTAKTSLGPWELVSPQPILVYAKAITVS